MHGAALQPGPASGDVQEALVVVRDPVRATHGQENAGAGLGAGAGVHHVKGRDVFGVDVVEGDVEAPHAVPDVEGRWGEGDDWRGEGVGGGLGGGG